MPSAESRGRWYYRARNSRVAFLPSSAGWYTSVISAKRAQRIHASVKSLCYIERIKARAFHESDLVIKKMPAPRISPLNPNRVRSNWPRKRTPVAENGKFQHD